MRYRLCCSVALAAFVVLTQAGEGHAQNGVTAGTSYGPGRRVLVDAHNAYPTEGRFEDRIDRALATGMPLAIEQDLFWLVDARSGVGRSVVAHVTEEAAGNPSFEDYFFKKVAPILDKALAENTQADWPLITLNLDFKSNEPEHHAAVWALLGKYERWLTTASAPRRPMFRRRCASDRCSCSRAATTRSRSRSATRSRGPAPACLWRHHRAGDPRRRSRREGEELRDHANS